MTSTLADVARAVGGTLRPPDAGTTEVHDLVQDSRAARPGTVFAAIRGARTDGHDHVTDAVRRGVSALLVERDMSPGVPSILVEDTALAVGPAAATVHARPSDQLAVVGVTGTNGKTTTVALVEAAVSAGGRGAAVVGTTGARVHGEDVPSVRTTPMADDLQRLLQRFVERGAQVAAVEVSSHGLAQHRVDGTRFTTAGFTMLGEDHLDFHRDREAYLAAKQRLFTPGLTDRAVVVVDGEAGRRVADEASVDVVTLSLTGGSADVVVEQIQLSLRGGLGRLRGELRGQPLDLELSTRLPGHHNLANAALALLLAIDVGIDPEAAAAGIAACAGVAGRMEPVAAPGAVGPTVLVDYAHTPDAVASVVASLRDLAPAGARLTVVLGAGGDRDTGKRSAMGAAAAGADLAVLTSDNPRSEDPSAILAAVEAGARAAVAEGAPAEVVVEADRGAAIRLAVARAGVTDVVLVAGKGHETGQEFATRTEPFDDRIVSAEALAARVAGTGGTT